MQVTAWTGLRTFCKVKHAGHRKKAAERASGKRGGGGGGGGVAQRVPEGRVSGAGAWDAASNVRREDSPGGKNGQRLGGSFLVGNSKEGGHSSPRKLGSRLQEQR